MRSPVLIAEIPATGERPGPRFLAPPGRGVDDQTAAHYLNQAREIGDDVEEIEGEDYLAVRLKTVDGSSGNEALLHLVLCGIDVDRLSGEERDEILDQLRERAEVLGDAVAALDWEGLADVPVVELPELDEWHEAGWDLLPRTGLWANGRVVAESDPKSERSDESENPTYSTSQGRADDRSVEDDFDRCQESLAPAPNTMGEVRPEQQEPTSDSWSEFENKSVGTAPHREAAVAPFTPEPQPKPTPGPFVGLTDHTSKPRSESPTAALTPAVLTHTNTLPDPEPDFIVPANSPPASKPIDPLQVSSAADRSPALAPPPAPAAVAPIPARRSVGWLVFPWATLVVLIASAYLYLTKLDRTWDQQVSEATFTRGRTRVIEKPVEVVVEKVVEKPVDRIIEKPVEKVVEKIVPAAAPDTQREDQWAKFVAEYRARMGRNEVVRAAEALQTWADYLPAWAGQQPPGLAPLQQDFQKTAPGKFREWAANRGRQDLRFADAHEGIAAFSASAATRALLDASKVAALAAEVRAEVRDAEDQFHYDRIRTLSAALPAGEDRLQQHLTAYLALHDPPGRMIGEVGQVIEYRDWVKKGRPARGTVRITWGPRTVPGEFRLDLVFGRGTRFSRTVSAKANDTWSDTFAIPADGVAPDGQIPYRVEIVRTTSAVEQLAEADRVRTEVFALDKGGPVETAHEPESGTKVAVEWSGVLSSPTLPPWKGATPVAPVPLPKKVSP